MGINSQLQTYGY